jgi:hypothetical protein
MTDQSMAALKELVALYRRNGALRLPNLQRRSKTPRSYKKGYEVRFVARSQAELRSIRRLLRQAGLPVASPFAKGRRFVQPLYGRENLQRFREALTIANQEAESSNRG